MADSTKVTREYVLAGKAIFTVEPAKQDQERLGLKAHYTYKVSNPSEDKPFFVSVLIGPQNTSDYAYLGILDPKTGALRLTAKSQFPNDSWQVKVFGRVVAQVWAGGQRKIEDAGWMLHLSDTCCRCGKLLTVSASIALQSDPAVRLPARRQDPSGLLDAGDGRHPPRPTRRLPRQWPRRGLRQADRPCHRRQHAEVQEGQGVATRVHQGGQLLNDRAGLLEQARGNARGGSLPPPALLARPHRSSHEEG